MSEPGRALARAVRYSGREREALTQAAKMAMAAVIAWAIARTFPSPQAQSFMAPYAAVFMMADTVYRSLATAVRQATAVVIGVLLAYVLAKSIPAPLAAVGVAVLVGAVIGQWNRLGDSGIWVAVTALLLLTYSTAEQESYLLYRVLETVLGAAIGVAVNMLVFPPVHLRQTRSAVAEMAEELRQLLCSIADELREQWDESTARSWLRRTSSLEQTVYRAKTTAELGRESTRFNLRWMLLHRHHYRQPADFHEPIGILSEVTEQLRRIVEALTRAADTDTGRPSADAELYRGLAGTLEAMADPVGTFYEPFTDTDREAFEDKLRLLRDRREGLAAVAEDTAPEIKGAILLAVEQTARILERAG